MPFVLLQIRAATKVLKSWYGCVVPADATVADAFRGFSDGSLDNGKALEDEAVMSCVQASVGNSKDGSKINVSPEAPVGDTVSALGHYVDFAVTGHDRNSDKSTTDNASAGRNAFALMMASVNATSSLPPKWTPVTSKKVVLKNDLIDFLSKNSLGWDHAHAESSGINFVGTLADALWYVDGNHHTLASRGCAVPAMFSHFTGYNKPEDRKKRKRDHTNILRCDLESLSASLFFLAGCSYMKHQSWKSVREAVLKMADNFRKYSAYLNDHATAVTASEAKRSCVRTDVDELKVVRATLVLKPTAAARYRSLHAAIQAAADYDYVMIEDHCPADHRRKHEYLEGLVMPVKCVLYSYTGGKTHVHFVWRIPEDVDDSELLQRNVRIQQEVKALIPKFHTRIMRREFIQLFGSLTNTKPAFLREAYRRLTGDTSASITTDQAAVDKRIAELFETEDPDLIWDLRVV
eukprot:scpid75942/ scgid21385/ 